MIRQHHQLNACEVEQTLGDSERQGSLACYSLQGCKESDMIQQLNNNNNERNQRQHKQLERYTMFLDWKNQYSENDSTTQSNQQIQFSSYQTTRLLGSQGKSSAGIFASLFKVYSPYL